MSGYLTVNLARYTVTLLGFISFIMLFSVIDKSMVFGRKKSSIDEDNSISTKDEYTT